MGEVLGGVLRCVEIARCGGGKKESFGGGIGQLVRLLND